MAAFHRNSLWVGVAVLVAVGWAAGYGFWEPESPGGDFGSYFDVFSPMLTLLMGAPLALLAGLLLRSSSRGLRIAGFGVLGATCLVLMYLASFSFFGGICLDPGDVCITTWPSRIAEFGAAIACLAAGWFVQGRETLMRSRAARS